MEFEREREIGEGVSNGIAESKVAEKTEEIIFWAFEEKRNG